MDVRDIPPTRSSGGGSQSAAGVPVRSLAATPISLINRRAFGDNGDSVAIQKLGSADALARADANSRVNDGISTGNLIVDAVSTLDSILTGIEEVVARASEAKLSAPELGKLETIARDLAGEFADRSAFTLSDGQQPFRGGIASFAEDQQFGPVTSLTFPDAPTSPLRTVESIAFSSPEAIVATAREVQRTRTSLDDYKRSASTLQSALAERSRLFAVVSQNQTAATAVVGDVDRASDLAEATQGLIGENPSQALDASSVRAYRVATLLDN